MTDSPKIKPIKSEIWKDIPNYEGLYQASNMGRIKRLYRIWSSKRRPGQLNHRKEGIVTQTTNPWGYVYVELSNINKKRKKYFVHVLVAITFIENPENKPCVNHKKGNKSDNRVSQLEWVTRSENTLHGYRIGLLKVNKTALGRTGALSPHSIPINQYTKEGIFIKTWSSTAEAARDLKLSQGNINSAIKGTYKSTGGFTWKYKQPSG